MEKVFESERFLMRRWEMSDAENLYRLACDGRVSSNGNWPRHESVDMSRAVLRDILSLMRSVMPFVIRGAEEW